MNHPADLHIPFLNKVLEKMREIPLDGDIASSHTFYEFVPTDYKDNERNVRFFVEEHLEYLRDIGLLDLDARTLDGTYHLIKLTADGRHFVQPELAEFYAGVTGQLVSAVEAKLDASSLPDDEKHTLKYKLKEAVATHGPDLAVRLMVEILSKLATAS